MALSNLTTTDNKAADVSLMAPVERNASRPRGDEVQAGHETDPGRDHPTESGSTQDHDKFRDHMDKKQTKDNDQADGHDQAKDTTGDTPAEKGMVVADTLPAVLLPQESNDDASLELTDEQAISAATDDLLGDLGLSMDDDGHLIVTGHEVKIDTDTDDLQLNTEAAGPEALATTIQTGNTQKDLTETGTADQSMVDQAAVVQNGPVRNTTDDDQDLLVTDGQQKTTGTQQVGQTQQVTAVTQTDQMRNQLQQQVGEDTGGEELRVQTVTTVEDGEGEQALLTPRAATVLTSGNEAQRTEGQQSINLPALSEQENAMDRAVASQINRALVQQLTDGQRMLQVRLTPPELGTVRVQIIEQAGSLQVRLGADDDGVRAALERALPSMRQELRGSDTPVADVQLADHYLFFGQQDQAEGQGRDQSGSGKGKRGNGGFSLDGDFRIDEAMAASASIVSDDLVDIRA